MRQKLVIGMLFFVAIAGAQVQTIKGFFPQLKGGELSLKAYNGFQEEELAKTTCDSTGRFALSYPGSYRGAALLKLQEAGNAVVLLNGENVEMEWTDVKDVNTLTFQNSPENDAFIKGFTVNRDANQKLAGLNYLLPQYEKDTEKYRWLKEEIALQENRFEAFVNGLSPKSYVSSYLKIRKFVADMSQTAQKDNGRIPQHEAYFKNTDLNNDRLWHSGLMADLYAGMYQLIANNKDTAKVNERINRLSDAWIKGLSSNAIRQQEVAEYCFKMLEQQNRLANSEYIATAMLNESSCQLDEKRTNLFEQYRKMALGNTAPDIELQNGQKLSTIAKKYKLVVFGASWCPNCQTDYPSLVGTYKRIKDKYDIEFLFVSLDSDKKAFDEFFKEAPFTTLCDTKGWASRPIKDYCVVATPSYFLLNKELKIVAKLKRPEELEFFLK